MSLRFVTKKLGDQSLEEEPLEKEDSGTESDDETETELGEEGEQGDSDNIDSGISLNLRSGQKVGGKTKQLPQLSKKDHIPAATATPPAAEEEFSQELIEDTDNHSSEEELEDIIGNSAKKKVYTSEPAAASIKTGGVCGGPPGRASAVEKRKWSEVDRSGGGGSQGLRAGSGSSGDEEVSGYMAGPYTPVQFCTSPPLNVYKPRRSQSPPPKLFHMAANAAATAAGLAAEARAMRGGGGTERSGGAFRPRCIVPASGGAADSAAAASCLALLGEARGGIGGDGEEDEIDGAAAAVEDVAEVEHRSSPNKRQRATPRPHNIQRPCLDFEKMQQIKTRVVTSWRQGTELSLFCW